MVVLASLLAGAKQGLVMAVMHGPEILEALESPVAAPSQPSRAVKGPQAYRTLNSTHQRLIYGPNRNRYAALQHQMMPLIPAPARHARKQKLLELAA